MQRLSAKLLCLGFKRKTGTLSLHDRVPAGGEEHRRLLLGLEDLAPERMILSTCERFEVYALTYVTPIAACVDRIAAWLGLSEAALLPHLCLRRGEAVAEHLLRVAAGLESRIVGEPQILSQVREAFQEASALGVLGPILGALARTALHTGKRTRSETELGRGARSLVSLTVERLRSELGSLGGRTVLVLGSGALARDVARLLSSRHAARIIVVSQVAARAEALAQECRGLGLTRADLAAGLGQADALVTCTAAPVVIDGPALALRQGPPLPILDLGVPPNVYISAEAIPAARLTSLEELLAERSRRPETRDAERIVAEELLRFARWHRERGRAPFVAALIKGLREETDVSARPRQAAPHIEITRVKAAAALTV